MKRTKYHIIYSICATILMCALLTPTLVKLSHIFQNHKHEVCTKPQSSHYHEYEIDCEFYKFNKTNQVLVDINHEFNLLEAHTQKTNTSYYNYLNSHRQLSVLLRGPPSV